MGNLKDELREIVEQTLNEKQKQEKSLNTVSPKQEDEKTQKLGEITTSTIVCEKCNGRGFYFVDYNTVRECECGVLEQERQENKLRFASIPDAYKDFRLKDWDISHYKGKNRDAAREIARNIKIYLENIEKEEELGKGLYFWSETKGSGKTMLMAAIANELVWKYRRFVKFATSLEILDEIRSTYNKDSEESESKLLNDLKWADFLVIDDFGTERATDWAGEKFYQIVNGRYINKKVTFFTSNHDLVDLDYDERIVSRVKERSFKIHFPEQSIRDIKDVLENKELEVQ